MYTSDHLFKTNKIDSEHWSKSLSQDDRRDPSQIGVANREDATPMTLTHLINFGPVMSVTIDHVEENCHLREG